MARGRSIHVVKLRWLRNELRRARDAAGLTQKQVAEDLGWSISKVIRLETGAGNITTSDVMALLHEYHITDEHRTSELLAITRQKDQTWWWDEYRELYANIPDFLRFLAYEDSASRIRTYHGLIVPGILQTEQYMRAVFNVTEDPQIVETGVQVRLRRQELLRRAAPPEVLALLDEGVLRRVVGGYELMIEQLAHLRALNEQPRVTIQVVPFAAGMVAGMNRSFTILDLSEQGDGIDVDYVVDVEDIEHDILVKDEPEVTSHYVEALFAIHEIALSGSETNDLLDAIAAEMATHR